MVFTTHKGIIWKKGKQVFVIVYHAPSVSECSSPDPDLTELDLIEKTRLVKNNRRHSVRATRRLHTNK